MTIVLIIVLCVAYGAMARGGDHPMSQAAAWLVGWVIGYPLGLGLFVFGYGRGWWPGL